MEADTFSIAEQYIIRGNTRNTKINGTDKEVKDFLEKMVKFTILEHVYALANTSVSGTKKRIYRFNVFIQFAQADNIVRSTQHNIWLNI